MPKFVSILTTLSLVVGVLAVALGCPALILMDNITGAGAMLVAGLVAILVGRLDHVEEFALGPLKARLRASIAEANATVQQLRAVALGFAEASLTDLMAGNFMDSMSLRQRLAVHDVIVKALVDLGVSQQDVQKVSADWNKGICLTYGRAIRKVLPNPDADARTAYDALSKFDEWREATPDEIQSFVDQRGLNTPNVAAWIDDYRHFLRTKEIRRLDEFVKQ